MLMLFFVCFPQRKAVVALESGLNPEASSLSSCMILGCLPSLSKPLYPCVYWVHQRCLILEGKNEAVYVKTLFSARQFSVTVIRAWLIRSHTSPSPLLPVHCPPAFAAGPPVPFASRPSCPPPHG